jgi:hypothetical protein
MVAAPGCCGGTSSVAPPSAGASAAASPGAPRTPPTPSVEAPDSAWPARRDPPARSAAGENHGARPSVRDATPESPAPLSDPSGREAARTRTGFGPRDRQTTRPRTPPELTTAEATRRDGSTAAIPDPPCETRPSLIFARARETRITRADFRITRADSPDAVLRPAPRASARAGVESPHGHTRPGEDSRLTEFAHPTGGTKLAAEQSLEGDADHLPLTSSIASRISRAVEGPRSLTIKPSARKRMRSAIAAAGASWVTMTVVWP